MRDQTTKIIDVSASSNVITQVVPFEAGAHPGVDNTFTLLEFDSAVLSCPRWSSLRIWQQPLPQPEKGEHRCPTLDRHLQIFPDGLQRRVLQVIVSRWRGTVARL